MPRDQLKLGFYFMLVIVVAAVVSSPFIGTGAAFGDSLANSATQRIGNYEVQMATDPAFPVAGKSTKIMLRIASIDGQDLVDVPIVISIAKENKEIVRTNPIFVPYGHHTYDYTFPEEGTYGLDVGVMDVLGNGQTITFTFRLQIVKYDLSVILPVSAAAIVVAIGAVAVLTTRNRRRKKAV